ncbi:MAG: dockerin type I repeat-containing protein, partial [bacterium]|nr:dockerin type I repeat-containing protein [bacterium]
MIKKIVFVTMGLSLLLVSSMFADWLPGDGHKMHFPQLPDETGWAVNATQPMILADDWQCSETGWIKDFHFWGAWKNGLEGQIQSFVLSIHDDIPADQSPTGWSMPGNTLREIEIFDWAVVPIDPPTLEGWYDPASGEIIPDDHQAYWQYNVFLPEADWFWQEQGTIYWFNISAIVADPSGTTWGWKSSVDHFNDDAVWATWGNLNWIEMYEPWTDPRVNDFFITVDPVGTFLGGGGSDAYGQGWYYYPNSEWWNIWFYDHPFTYDNRKVAHIEYDIFPLTPEPSFVEIAVNWSTDFWSLDHPPGDSFPPLPGEDEALYIGREILYAGEVVPGHYTFDWTWPDYNPEWVSIDVRGFNFEIPGGFIRHDCNASLDLSFVVTGGAPDTCDNQYPGDVNNDGTIGINDITYLVNWLYMGGAAPPVMANADPNGDCCIDIDDIVYLIDFVYKGGPPPVACTCVNPPVCMTPSPDHTFGKVRSFMDGFIPAMGDPSGHPVEELWPNYHEQMLVDFWNDDGDGVLTRNDVLRFWSITYNAPSYAFVEEVT